ncbi:MAG: NAD(P)H-dependent oxidoreductase [Alphaproteobacteria bacterium]
MPRKIVVIEGHPDPSDQRLCHALADAYAEGAGAAGHAIRRIRIAVLDVPPIRSAADWRNGTVPDSLQPSQQALAWADHIVLVYPLWLGTLPALTKAWLEQVLRPGFAMDAPRQGLRWRKRLTGKSARVVVTMGMPALAYRWLFFAHSLKALERNILKFCGIGPIRTSLVGGAESMDDAARRRWLARLRQHGERGD